VVALALPLKVAPSVILLHGAIIDSAWAFLRKVCEGDILSVGTQLLMKASKYGGDFPTRLIEQSILHRGDEK